jgi:hypothetical protein
MEKHMTEEDERRTEEEAADYRLHWHGSRLQEWRTRIVAVIIFLAFTAFILYHYGVRLYPVPPPS